MIKTVWIQGYFKKKGKWEEYEEATGETKRGLFGEKAVTIKKKRWVELDEYCVDRRDGERLTRDTQDALTQLDSEGFDVMCLTPVTSGEYSWTNYGTSASSSSTCASWGYSFTEGVMVTARQRDPGRGVVAMETDHINTEDRFMRNRIWGLIAPLAIFTALLASAGNAFATAGDVAPGATYRGWDTNTVYGREDCRSMGLLPTVESMGMPVEGLNTRVMCSSRALGTDLGDDGREGFYPIDYDGTNWSAGNEVSSDTGLPQVLCPFTNPDDYFADSMSDVGNPNGDYYHEIVVGVDNDGPGIGEHWLLSYDPGLGAFQSTACSKLTFTTSGLLDGFSGKVINIGDHDGDSKSEFCTANYNAQILCFEFSGLAVDPASEVLLDATDLPGLHATIGHNLALTYSNGMLFVADNTDLRAVTLSSTLSVDSALVSALPANCGVGSLGSTSVIENGPDLDLDLVPELLLGNETTNSFEGIFCELFMNSDGTIRNAKVMASNQFGVPLLETETGSPLPQHGADILYYGDNGDCTHKVLVSVPTADSNSHMLPSGQDGGFMEYNLESASCGLPTVCDPQPDTNCFEGSQGSLKISNNGAPEKNSMKWQLKKGEAFGQATLGDPTMDDYAICIYDKYNGGTRIASTYEIAPSGVLWASKDPKGFQYKDKAGTSDGVTQVKIKTGDAGKTSVQVAWKGLNLTLPTYVGGGVYFTADPALTIQLHNEAGNCWSSSFSLPFKANDIEKVQASFKP